MNNDYIIRLAIEHTINGLKFNEEGLLRFAKLVAQHEREIWERKYERLQSLMDIQETQPNKPCCLAEREACAKLCFEMWEKWMDADPRKRDNLPRDAEDCATAIRARGQA
jgi:hypothetical protein